MSRTSDSPAMQIRGLNYVYLYGTDGAPCRSSTLSRFLDSTRPSAVSSLYCQLHITYTLLGLFLLP